MGRAVSLVVLLAALPFAARADDFVELRRLSANPDTARFGAGWREHLRATLGAELPALGGDGGHFLRFPAMVELHNVGDNPAPNNLWRGLLGLELGFRGAAWGVSLLLQHESDHETARHGGDQAGAGFYQLNSAGARLDRLFAAGSQRVLVSLIARLHVFTCTTSVARCAEGVGSRAFESSAEVVWTGRPASGAFAPVAAAYADWIVPNALVGGERRLVLEAGAWLRTGQRGTFQLVAIGWLDNEVGYVRRERVQSLGAAFRWTP